FVVCKLLGFPLVKYANSRRRRKTAQIASTVAIIVMIPSVILFVKLLRQQVFESKATEFIENTIRYSGSETLKAASDFKNKTIDVYLIGNTVPVATITTWQERLGEIEALKEANLVVHQGNDQAQDINRLSTELRSGILEDLYVKNQEVLQNKDKRIELLESELSKYRGDAFSFADLSKEAKINYENIEEIGYSNLITTNFQKQDTIPTFTITWDRKLRNTELAAEQSKFEKWIKVRLNLDTLSIKNVR
ncbi:MAG: hypothetical protein KJP01_06355, partial [Gramella sp.]|nr:hypothetical protein [Christiangramia sp.]